MNNPEATFFRRLRDDERQAISYEWRRHRRRNRWLTIAIGFLTGVGAAVASILVLALIFAGR
jgi:hypothetical protein